MNWHDITTMRLRIRKNGFDPIPVEGKEPHMPGWQTKFNITSEEIQLWPKSWHLAASTGVLAKFAPGLDIDILIEAAAEAVEMLAREYFEEHGDIYVRVGQAPKRLIPLRTDEPFTKLFFVLTDRSGNEHKIEMLGDGQQYVVDGIHPKTHKPYRWHGGELETIKRENCPYVRHASAKQFLEAALKLLLEQFGEEFGLKLTSTNLTTDPINDDNDHDEGDDPHADPKLIRAALAVTPNTADWERWYTTGMAIWRATAGSAEGFAVWDEWSRRNPAKYNAHNTARKWSDFFRSPPTRIGAGTIFHYAEQASPGWRQEYEARKNDPPPADPPDDPPDDPPARPKLTATPHTWRDPSTLPPRDFLYGDCLIRGYVSGIVSMGGVGKTSEVQVEVAAMVTGRDLLGVKPKRSYRVWYINLEDPQEEIDRRFAAIFKHYGITAEDLGNRLFTDSGRDKNFTVARQSKNGIEFDKDVIYDIDATIRENAIDCFIVDPLVNSARFAENDNNAMANIIEHVWGKIAERQRCAGKLVHHVRKGGPGQSGFTVEDARGASALVNSCRNVRVLNVMTKDEGEKAGVEHHRSYFRIDNGKANLAPPPEESEWRKIVSVPLGNATEDCPQDRIGVVTAWEWPDPLESLTVQDLIAAQKAVSAGGPWRKDSQAENWVGKPIATALGLDIDSKTDKAKIKGALKIWTENKMFKEVSGQDDKRNKRIFVEVGTQATAGATVIKMKASLHKRTSFAQTAASPEFKAMVVGNAPKEVACVKCQTIGDRPVLKIKDGRVPPGQPGGEPECLHWQCAEDWFTGKF